jgi:glycosyltransferase involved in cell wall biosynthesis
VISAIVPTFDRAPRLARALDSILAQTRPADELIVVDDGSTDGTRELIAERFPAVRYLRQENQGVSAARNLGIAAALGDWIALLDSDDEWRPEKLERQLLALAGSGAKICHTDEIWIRGGRRVNPGRRYARRSGRIFRDCLPLCAISPSSVLIHRTVFAAAGTFDEQLPACEDYDLWLRICSCFPVLLVDEPLVIRHGGRADQLSRSVPGLDRYRIRALEKILLSGDLDAGDRHAALATLIDKTSIFAQGAARRGRDREAAAFRAGGLRWAAELEVERSW